METRSELGRTSRHSRTWKIALLTALTVTTAAAALAAETIRYEYDARGRLVKVVRTDPATNAVKTTTDYSFDKADNRTKREVKQ